jgi:transglutaminase-like putative cysteine protease
MGHGAKPGLFSLLAPAAARPASLPHVIERYFDVSLFLLVVTGFVTLSSTGRLDSFSVLAVSAALLIRAGFLLQDRKVVIPDSWSSYLALCYVLVFGADLFFVSGSFVTAAVHLVLFSMVVKIFSVRRDRDHLYLAILSFLEVLAAAVLTVDTTFLVAFLVFMLLAVTTFISMEMKRSAAAALKPLPAPALPRHTRRMALALSATGAVLMLAIFTGAAGIFFVLPRLSAGYLSAYAPHNEFVTGFSDQVRLGEIGRIKQSDTVVMHIQVENDRGGLADIKWRGIALADFDGRQWSNPAGESVEIRAAGGRFDFLPSQVRLRNLPQVINYRTTRGLFYRVVMEPLGTQVLFLAAVPASLQGRMREIGLDDAGSVFNLDRGRLIESYRAYSLLPQPSAQLLRSRSRAYPPDVVLTYLQLPHVDRRVRQLAAQITAGAASDYDKAVTLEEYLKTHYGYSLQLPSTPPADPLVYFLFERREGHCEYFASAMAVMLRVLGIPARIVNGFRNGEYNDLTGNYIIRGRDAHSWVEAYLPAYGWVSFDPTPPDPKPAAGDWNRFLLYVDAAREFWREWVINYDFLHQRTLSVGAAATLRQFFDRGRMSLRARYFALLARARHLRREASQSPGEWGAGAMAVVIFAMLLVNLPRIWRTLRRRHLARNPGRAPQAAATLWYARMTRSLARRGYRRRPAQTPGEFASLIADTSLRQSVSTFTRHYERARFGDSAADASRLPELFEEIKAK